MAPPPAPSTPPGRPQATQAAQGAGPADDQPVSGYVLKYAGRESILRMAAEFSVELANGSGRLSVTGRSDRTYQSVALRGIGPLSGRTLRPFFTRPIA